jgi:putative heme iron utilization protein
MITLIVAEKMVRKLNSDAIERIALYKDTIHKLACAKKMQV